MPNLLAQNSLPFRDRPLLFIDFETTGLDVRQHEIIEVAALVVSPHDLSITNSYYTKVLPDHIATADPTSLTIVGYSDKDWESAIPLPQMLQELSQLAPDALLAGWSVQTEWDFLIAALEKHDMSYFFTHKLIEVYTLAYTHFYSDPTIKFLNLRNTAKALGIYLDQHKPDSDIRATFEIFKRLNTKNPAT